MNSYDQIKTKMILESTDDVFTKEYKNTDNCINRVSSVKMIGLNGIPVIHGSVALKRDSVSPRHGDVLFTHLGGKTTFFSSLQPKDEENARRNISAHIKEFHSDEPAPKKDYVEKRHG